MHAFDVLGDPVRRRILDLIADGELSSGAITAVVQEASAPPRPPSPQPLRVLRDSGFATVRPEGTRRLYTVDAAPFRELDDWLAPLRPVWGPRPRPPAPAAARAGGRGPASAAAAAPRATSPKRAPGGAASPARSKASGARSAPAASRPERAA